MEQLLAILLPFVLLMSRTAAFVVVLPIFGWRSVPVVVRAGVALVVTVFFAVVACPGIDRTIVHWPLAVILIVQETIIGLALGLAVRFVYSAVQQAGLIAARQMGFADAGIIDPVSGSRSRPLSTLFEMTFALFFLSANGHHLLVRIVAHSFRSFPVAAEPDVLRLTAGLVEAGSAMLLFALKLASPMLAGFLILAVLLCILARVLPEMNILLASFPLRMGMGLVMAAAIVPSMNAFTSELARWMNRFLVT